MTEKLTKAADDSGSQRGNVHVHFRPTHHVQAIDGASVHAMLKSHREELPSTSTASCGCQPLSEVKYRGMSDMRYFPAMVRKKSSF